LARSSDEPVDPIRGIYGVGKKEAAFILLPLGILETNARILSFIIWVHKSGDITPAERNIEMEPENPQKLLAFAANTLSAP
jgi:hypothetical protein